MKTKLFCLAVIAACVAPIGSSAYVIITGKSHESRTVHFRNQVMLLPADVASMKRLKSRDAFTHEFDGEFQPEALPNGGLGFVATGNVPDALCKELMGTRVRCMGYQRPAETPEVTAFTVKVDGVVQ